MGNELAVIQAAEWEILTAQAKALVQSGFLPKAIDTPQKAVAIIMLGKELGIAPWASMSSINVIQGKPSVSPQLMLALINRSGQLEDMLVEGDERQCSVTMKRKGRAPHTEAFSIDEARKMNVTNKPTWQSIPGTMLKWRAVAACARVVFPDVILGLYTPDEMGADVAVDETGNMEVISVAEPDAPRLAERTSTEVSTDQPSASVRGAGIAVTEPKQWSDDAAQWQAFLASARDKLTMTEATVVEVLDIFDALELADWRTSKSWALAALIADNCENDPVRIDETTSRMTAGMDEGQAFALRNRANLIAAAMQQHDSVERI